MTYEERLNEVKRMDDEVRNFNDEDLIMRWLMVGVPDEASEDDYEWFANDLVEFHELCALYHRLKKEEEAQ